MPTIWQRVVNNPQSTIKGALIFVIVTSGVLAKYQSFPTTPAGWAALVGALAFAVVSAYGLDPGSAEAAHAQAVSMKKAAAKNG